MTYLRTYGERTPLYLCCLTPEQHARTCDYWYTVTEGATAHTAFRTREALLQWLDLNGLRLERELPAERGTHDVQRIQGSYRTCMHMDEADFYAQSGTRLRVLSNGRWTLGIITTDTQGVRTRHSLNPNVSTRPDFDWRESQALEDAGSVVIRG